MRSIRLAHLEGEAAVGRVSSVKLEPCGTERLAKVVASLVTGEVVETRCLDRKAAEKVLRCIAELKALSTILVEK